jgi:hypothetical protein
MQYGAELKILINKLKERGVINKSRAEALRRLASKLDSPTSKAMRHLLVKAIVDILTEVTNSR